MTPRFPVAIANRLQVGGVHLHYCRYDAPVQIAFPAMAGYRQLVCLSGHGEMIIEAADGDRRGSRRNPAAGNALRGLLPARATSTWCSSSMKRPARKAERRWRARPFRGTCGSRSCSPCPAPDVAGRGTSRAPWGRSSPGKAARQHLGDRDVSRADRAFLIETLDGVCCRPRPRSPGGPACRCWRTISRQLAAPEWRGGHRRGLRRERAQRVGPVKRHRKSAPDLCGGAAGACQPHVAGGGGRRLGDGRRPGLRLRQPGHFAQRCRQQFGRNSPRRPWPGATAALKITTRRLRGDRLLGRVRGTGFVQPPRRPRCGGRWRAATREARHRL